jgi:hypothetical protein
MYSIKDWRQSVLLFTFVYRNTSSIMICGTTSLSTSTRLSLLFLFVSCVYSLPASSKYRVSSKTGRSRITERALPPPKNPWQLQFGISEGSDFVMCPYIFIPDHNPHRFPNVTWKAELRSDVADVLCSSLLNGTCVPIYSTRTFLDLTSTGGKIKRNPPNYTEEVTTSFSCKVDDSIQWKYFISPVIKNILKIYNLDKKMSKPNHRPDIWSKFAYQTENYIPQLRKEGKLPS